MSKIILTGDRPTGKLHVGHYVGSLKGRVQLQNSGKYDEVFIMIADAQALTDNADNPENTAFKATTVPVGEDQLPMLEQTKEIVRKFNSIYGETLVEPEVLLPSNQACLRLPGIDGKAKMSKSLNNCIYLSDSADDVKKKIMNMFTDPNHLKVSDPGKVDGNPVFIYLDAFCQEHHFEEFLPEYANLDVLKAHYTRGGLGDVKVKRFLNEVIQEELEPIRKRRKEYEKDIPAIYEILKKGSEKAEEVAAKTLSEVKSAMKINYFDDADLIREQAERFQS